MRLHYLQHVPFEDPAYILTWAKKNNHILTCTRLDLNHQLPSPGSFDLLVIMGGPMNIYEYEAFPWLKEEKDFIRNAISAGKKVLGICLGAQLIADVLGGKVKPGKHKEIGWHPVELTQAAQSLALFRGLPREFSASHWHGDYFELPESAVLLASSQACPNQAFLYKSRVLALQFHLESTQESIKKLIEHCRHELVQDNFIQSEEEIILANTQSVPAINNLLEKLLDNWCTGC